MFARRERRKNSLGYCVKLAGAGRGGASAASCQWLWRGTLLVFIGTRRLAGGRHARRCPSGRGMVVDESETESLRPHRDASEALSSARATSSLLPTTPKHALWLSYCAVKCERGFHELHACTNGGNHCSVFGEES